MVGFCEHSNESLVFIRCREVLGQVSVLLASQGF
jgi:hypothetical protein